MKHIFSTTIWIFTGENRGLCSLRHRAEFWQSVLTWHSGWYVYTAWFRYCARIFSRKLLNRISYGFKQYFMLLKIARRYFKSVNIIFSLFYIGNYSERNHAVIYCQVLQIFVFKIALWSLDFLSTQCFVNNLCISFFSLFLID